MEGVLIVEDDSDIREALQTILEMDDIKVHTATNGSEAIDMLSDHSFDLIITDIMMPIKTGIDLLEFLKQTRKNIPVIVLSQFEVEEIKIKLNSNNISPNDVFEWMRKPFRIGDILLTVEQARQAHKM